MKTQVSRDSYDPDKRYSGVFLQQGRMITDADWNEEAEIARGRLDDALRDTLASGIPREHGLKIDATPGQPLRLRRGRLYAEGVGAVVTSTLPEPDAPFGLHQQADLPLPDRATPPAGNYRLYADVWERSVTSLEDPTQLRDPAFHGADTASRTQTMAQLKWCDTGTDPEDPVVNPPIGDARLTLTLQRHSAALDACDPCASEIPVAARIGNYLFRLEVHAVEGSPRNPTGLVLKWSSENGAEQHAVDHEPADFAGTWIYEYFDWRTEKHLGVHLPGGIAPRSGQVVEQFPAEPPPEGLSFVRRWDGVCTLARQGDSWTLVGGRERGVALSTDSAADADGRVSLGGGVVAIQLSTLRLELTLADRTFVAGDYWLVSIREAVHRAGDMVLQSVPPLGIRHHYLTLDAINAKGGQIIRPTDLAQRLDVPSLTTLKARDIDYTPACPSGLFSPTHDTVQKALDRVCAIDATQIAFTPPSCETSVFKDVSPQTVNTVAEALGLLCNVRADQIAYRNDLHCTTLSNATTVQEALRLLCLQRSISGCCMTVGEGGNFPNLQEAIQTLRNDNRLSLCLLPGNHSLEAVAELLEEPVIVKHLSLKGCGSASVLRLQGKLTLQAFPSVRLSNLAIELHGQAALTVGGGAEVVIEDCAITISDHDASTPLRLSAFRRVRLSRNDVRVVSFDRLTITGVIFTGTSELAGLFSESSTIPNFGQVVTTITSLPLERRRVLSAQIKRAINQAQGPQQAGGKSQEAKLLPTEVAVFQEFATAVDAGEEKSLPKQLFTVLPKIHATLIRPQGLTPAVVLEALGGDVVLTDNSIAGLVSLYGDPGQDALTRDELTLLNLRLLSGEIHLRGMGENSLILTRNRIDTVRAGYELIRQLRKADAGRPVEGLFQTARWTDNVFTGMDNELVCVEATLTGNRFASVQHNLGSVIARKTFYFGNHGGSEEAGILSNVARDTIPDKTRRDINGLVIVDMSRKI